MAEVMIASTLLVVGIGGLTHSVGSTIKLSRMNREQALAEAAAERAIAQLRDTTFSQVFASFNAATDDDPGGIGTAPGASFDVSGLNAQVGDPDGLAGEIVFPTEQYPAAGGRQLREDVVDPQLGMPRDLNGDDPLVFDSLDHAADYIVLPVIVRVRWNGISGNSLVELKLILVE